MASILIVEDEFVIGAHLRKLLTDMGYEVTGLALNSKQALDFLDKIKPDLMILDISLGKGLDGIEIAELLDQKYSIPYIFLTSHTDPSTLERVKKVNPAGYLVKPFKPEDINVSIELGLSNYARKNYPEQNPEDDKAEQETHDKPLSFPKSIFIKKNKVLKKLLFDEIAFVKSDRVYLEIVLTDGKKEVIRESIHRFILKLPPNFLKIHRSYLINMDHIDEIGKDDVKVQGEEIPVSKNYRDELLSRINY